MKSWRNTPAYHHWRKAVIERDGKCVICGSTKHLEAHHMNHATYFKEDRFKTSNGVCLCYHCHMHFHNDFKRSYRTKCTKYDFNNFKVLTNYFKETFIEREDNETKK